VPLVAIRRSLTPSRETLLPVEGKTKFSRIMLAVLCRLEDRLRCDRAKDTSSLSCKERAVYWWLRIVIILWANKLDWVFSFVVCYAIVPERRPRIYFDQCENISNSTLRQTSVLSFPAKWPCNCNRRSQTFFSQV